MNKGDKLNAKCPHCEYGCDRCQDGYITVTLGEDGDIMYALVCNDCDAQIGGGFLNPKTINIINSMSKGAKCPFCGSRNVERIIDE